MKYDFPSLTNPQNTRRKIDKRTAYHLAGHAVAVYLGNKQKQLPEVHFRITIGHQGHHEQHSGQVLCSQGCTGIIEGGRLIQNLPQSVAEFTRYLVWPQQEQYLRALEADVINLLAGSLAEAKSISSWNSEIFSTHKLNLSALHLYGGTTDLITVAEYMECYLPDKESREQKLTELFFAAISFVYKRSNWQVISDLAEFIMREPKSVIHCEEVVGLLESRLAA
jgi:hypothetical protein